MSTAARRVVIVGAGVTGLLTAVRCALAGHRVTVLDCGAIPNPRSTSYDQHRAIRALDPDDPAATRRVAAAHLAWQALETVLGTRFYRRVGVLTAWPAAYVDTVTAVAATAELPVAVVEPEKFPHIRFPVGSPGVLEFDAGVLLADRVLHAAAGWLHRHPAVTLTPGQPVVAVDAARARVTLAGGARLSADLVLVAAGPWSRDLVDLPTVLHRQTIVYLRPPADLVAWWERAPSAGRIGADGRAWLLPPGEGTLLKLSSATLCQEVAAVEPVDRDLDGDERRWAEQVVDTTLADAHRYTVVMVKQCHYAVDAGTGGGRLVRIGPAVWARAASGGDGFRTAPLVADRIVAALAASTPGKEHA